ncbi:MAG: hypothetical protein K2H09_03410 [Treponemataceae bacterium]|nr:hypothetical protein [Treponemataceae bacterium]
MQNIKSKLWLIVFACFAGFASAQTYSVDEVVDSEYLAELKEKRIVSIIHEKNDTAFSIVPDCLYEEKIKSEMIEKGAKNVPFVAEFLYLIPKSELLKNSEKSDITTDDISVVLRSISKMTGMRYHVTEKNPKGELLYKKAYMIASPDSDEPIPDQNTGNADGQVSYCYQHDHTYGDTKYKLNYYQDGGALYASFLIISPLSYIGIKAVMPENMKISVVSLDCGDDLLLYLSTDVNAKNIAMANVRKQIKESMIARMEAVYQWFLVQF